MRFELTWKLCNNNKYKIFIYNWLLKYILTILPAAEPGPLEVRGDGERPRGVLPLPGSLASPTLADNWLIPKRQNVLVRDICTLTLLIRSRGNCPNYPFLLDGRMQSEALVSCQSLQPLQWGSWLTLVCRCKQKGLKSSSVLVLLTGV